jgi:hypothetical protein
VSLAWARKVLERTKRGVGRVAHVKRVRVARILSTALAIGLAAYMVRTKIVERRRGLNWAAGKSVLLSSENKKYGRPPEGLVDGKTDAYGFCTKDSNKPWAEIELGQPRLIKRVVVHNRYDCCEDRALPLSIELSTDRHKYETISRVIAPFKVHDVTFPPRRARFVRLIVRGPKTILHLNEVEVY